MKRTSMVTGQMAGLTGKNLLVAVVLTPLATVALAAPASAAPPTPIEPQPLPVTVPLCGVDLTFTEEVFRAREHKNGRVTGAVKVRVTNEATGKTVLVNASGPGAATKTELGNDLTQLDITFTGTSLVSVFPGEEALFRDAGLPDLFVTKGPTRLTTVTDFSNPDAPLVVRGSIDVPSRITNLCAVLV